MAKLREADKKYDDLYKHMIGLKENLDIINNEQQILSQELTDKQNQLLKAQREVLQAESELVQLRPMKEHLNSLTTDSKRQIEDSVKAEFERTKLNTKLREQESQITLQSVQLQEL